MSVAGQEWASAALERASELASGGDADAALEAAVAAWARVQDELPIDDPVALSVLRACALLSVDAGRYEPADEYAQVMLRVLDPRDPRRAFALTDRAQIALARGEPEAAEAWLEQAVETLDDLVDEPGVALVPPLAGLATLAAVRPDGLEAARAHTARALDVLVEAEGEASSRVADTLLFSALLELKAGAPRGAKALAARAATLHDQLEAPVERRAVARYVVAEALRMLGDPRASASLRAEARRLAESAGIAEALELDFDRLREDLARRLSRSGPEPRPGRSSPR